MTSNAVLIIAYGAVVIGSVFLMISLGRVALAEATDAHRLRDLRHNGTFVIAASVFVQSVALFGIGSMRVHDGFHELDIGGSTPLFLIIFLFMLVLAKAGFHWAASLGRRRILWRLFVALELLWIVGLSFYLA